MLAPRPPGLYRLSRPRKKRPTQNKTIPASVIHSGSIPELTGTDVSGFDTACGYQATLNPRPGFDTEDEQLKTRLVEPLKIGRTRRGRQEIQVPGYLDLEHVVRNKKQPRTAVWRDKPKKKGKNKEVHVKNLLTTHLMGRQDKLAVLRRVCEQALKNAINMRQKHLVHAVMRTVAENVRVAEMAQDIYDVLMALSQVGCRADVNHLMSLRRLVFLPGGSIAKLPTAMEFGKYIKSYLDWKKNAMLQREQIRTIREDNSKLKPTERQSAETPCALVKQAIDVHAGGQRRDLLQKALAYVPEPFQGKFLIGPAAKDARHSAKVVRPCKRERRRLAIIDQGEAPVTVKCKQLGSSHGEVTEGDDMRRQPPGGNQPQYRHRHGHQNPPHWLNVPQLHPAAQARAVHQPPVQAPPPPAPAVPPMPLATVQGRDRSGSVCFPLREHHFVYQYGSISEGSDPLPGSNRIADPRQVDVRLTWRGQCLRVLCSVLKYVCPGCEVYLGLCAAVVKMINMCTPIYYQTLRFGFLFTITCGFVVTMHVFALTCPYVRQIEPHNFFSRLTVRDTVGDLPLEDLRGPLSRATPITAVVKLSNVHLETWKRRFFCGIPWGWDHEDRYFDGCLRSALLYKPSYTTTPAIEYANALRTVSNDHSLNMPETYDGARLAAMIVRHKINDGYAELGFQIRTK